MNLEEQDFEGMTYPIFNLDKRKTVLSEFPRLAQDPMFKIELPEGLNRDKVMRFIVFMYDNGSPLSAIDNERGQRSVYGLELAGFKDENGTFSEVVEDMIDYKVESVQKMIVAFLRSINSAKYTNLKIQEMLYYVEASKAFTNPEKAQSGKITSLSQSLQSAMSEFLKGEENVNLIRSVYEIIRQEDLGLSPEAVIRRHAKGEKVFEEVKASSGEG